MRACVYVAPRVKIDARRIVVAKRRFSTLSTLRALRHVRPSVESELVWRGEREETPLPACQPWTPAVATPRGAGVPERPRNRTS